LRVRGCYGEQVKEVLEMRLDHLYERRTARGWSQYDLADVSGVPQPTISRAENGLRVSRRTALLLAGALGVDVDSLSIGEQPTITLRVADVPPELMDALSRR
jgi:transcriptional regulator with XRE-family HTH domain